MPTMDDFRLLSRRFLSESANNIAMVDDDVDGSVVRFRPRARSLRYINHCLQVNYDFLNSTYVLSGAHSLMFLEAHY